jgi:hypothetical protein
MKSSSEYTEQAGVDTRYVAVHQCGGSPKGQQPLAERKTACYEKLHKASNLGSPCEHGTQSSCSIKLVEFLH